MFRKESKKRFFAVLMAGTLLMATSFSINCTDVKADDNNGEEITLSDVEKPDYYFTMDRKNSNVVAVAREGDTSNFTVDMTVEGHEGGVFPTEETAEQFENEEQDGEATKGIKLKYVAGRNKKALFLDRSRSYGAELKNIDLGDKSWTVSFWVKPSSTIASFMPVFYTCSQDADQPDMTKWLSITKTGEGWLNGYSTPCIFSRNALLDGQNTGTKNNDLCFPWYAYQDNEGTWVGDGDDPGANGIATGKWTYVTLVIDANDTCEYGTYGEDCYVKGPHAWTYINGELFGNGTVAPDVMSSTNKFYLGINLWDCPVKGYYDDVAFWKKALTATQVKSLYKAEGAGAISEDTGGEVTEESGEEEKKQEVVTQTDSQTADTNVQNTANPTDSSATDTSAANSAKKKKIKLSSVKAQKGKKKITGKVSVSHAVVRIKVGKKAYKKARVKGKKFTLKTAKLKKKTKIKIKVSKKGYQTLVKTYKVK